MMTRKYPAMLAITALWCVLPAPSHVTAEVLESIEVTTTDGSAVIQANFSVPVHYVKHFPSEPAKILQIYLRVTTIGQTDKQRLRERRSVRAPPSKHVPLLDVIYVGDGVEGPHLIARFSRSVRFTVRQGKDNRSILIVIPTSVSKRKTLPSRNARQSEPPPQKTAKPSSVRDKSADIVKKEPAKKRTKTDDGRYAVTLLFSFKPISNLASIRKNLAEFRERIVYQISATLFGFKVYTVRLGFFPTPDEANAAKKKLSSKYPTAWVTQVTEGERVAALKAKPRKKRFKLAKTRKGVTPKLEKKADTEHRYVINLESSLGSPTPPKPLPHGLEKYRLYTTTSTKDGRVWRRLRLGFFATEGEAQRVRRLIEAIYPRAWIDIVSQEERESSAKTAVVLGDPKFALRKPEAQVVAEPEGDVDELTAQGRHALTRGDNIQAIRIFSKILSLPKNKHTQDAQEFLGLARERNGQIALAKVEYKLYLKLYPRGEGADRVRQRLANLTRSEKTVQVVDLRKPREEEVHEWSVFGSLSQDYLTGKSRIDTTTTVGNIIDQGTLSEVDQSALLSHLDMTGRFRNTKYDNRAVFSGSMTRNLLESENDSRVSSAYFDVLNRPHDYSARVGRQSGTKGVLSRFDGGLFGYSFRPKWRVNFLAGLPIDDVAPESDRKLYGLSFDMGPFADHWSSTAYVINQDVDSITDRQAVGVELRYFHPKRSFFWLVDYDVYFGELNIATLQGSWQPGKSTTFNLILDYRKTPPLQTTNALLGQAMESIEELFKTKNEGDVKQMAEALTATSEIFTIGAVRSLSNRLQLGGDITVANISETEGTAEVPAAEGTGNIFTYSTQLIGSNLLFTDDVSVFTLSNTESDSFNARSLSFVERVPFKKRWRVDISLKIYDQDNNNGTKLLRLTPTFKLDYRGKKNFAFEIEVAQERTKVTGATDEEETTRDFVRLSYRRDF